MKYINQLLAVILVLSYISNVQCQTFGIKAGLNIGGLALSNSKSYTSDDNYRLGIHLGGTFESPISTIFKLENGLILSTRNYQIKLNSIGMEFIEDFNPYYLQVPVNVKYHFKSAKSGWYIIAGPYLSMGIGGSSILKSDDFGFPFNQSRSIEWGADNGGLNRFELGFNSGIGIDFNSFSILLAYEFGLTNIRNFGSDINTRNRLFALSLAYKFSKRENTNNETKE